MNLIRLYIWTKSYGSCVYVFCLFHLTPDIEVASTLLKTTGFYFCYVKTVSLLWYLSYFLYLEDARLFEFFQLLWLLLQWTWECRCFFSIVVPLQFSIVVPLQFDTVRIWTAGSYGGLIFNILINAILFFTMSNIFVFQLVRIYLSGISTHWPTFVMY